MKTIWKFPLRFGTRVDNAVVVRIKIPRGAEVLHVHEQDESGYMWARCDPEQPFEEREFLVVGTGWPDVPSEGYLGTFHSGPYVWHVFERKVECRSRG